MKMRRLIPTISMALLGASLLGTSTYAWFSANDKASADGLTITARSASSLLISNDKTNWGTQASMNYQTGYSGTVDPVTEGKVSGTASTDKLDFKKVDDATKKKIGADGAAPADATYVAAADGDVAKSNLYLQYQGEASKTVNVNATLSTSSTSYTNLFKSVRVVLATKGTATKVASFSFSKLGEATSDQTFTILSTATTDFDIYMWIEGTDSNCVTNNSVNCGVYALKFDFSI